MADRVSQRFEAFRVGGARDAATNSACSMKSCASTKSSATASCARCAARSGHCVASALPCWAWLSRAARTTFANRLPFCSSSPCCRRAADLRLRSRRRERAQEVLNANVEFADSRLRSCPRCRRAADPHRMG